MSWFPCGLAVALLCGVAAQRHVVMPPMLGRGGAMPRSVSANGDDVLKTMPLDHPAVIESAKAVAAKYHEQIQAESTCNLTTVLSAYAAPGRAMVAKMQEIHTPIGDLEVMAPMMESGATYYLVLLTHEYPSSPMEHGLNPWPKWQLHCAAVFDSEKEEEDPVVEQHLIPKERILPPNSADVQHALAKHAVGHVSRMHGTAFHLAAVSGYEMQETTFEMVQPSPDGGQPITTKSSVSVDYIAFITTSGHAHMAALSKTQDGKRKLDVVAYASGLPRHFLVSWNVTLHDARALELSSYRAALGTSLKRALQVGGALAATLAKSSWSKERVQVNLQPVDHSSGPLVLQCALSVRPQLPAGSWLSEGDRLPEREYQEITKVLRGTAFRTHLREQLQVHGGSSTALPSISQPQARTPSGHSLWARPATDACLGSTSEMVSVQGAPSAGRSHTSAHPAPPTTSLLSDGTAVDAASQQMNTLHRPRGDWESWEMDVIGSFLAGGLLAGSAVALLWWRAGSEKGGSLLSGAAVRETVPLMSTSED